MNFLRIRSLPYRSCVVVIQITWWCWYTSLSFSVRLCISLDASWFVGLVNANSLFNNVHFERPLYRQAFYEMNPTRRRIRSHANSFCIKQFVSLSQSRPIYCREDITWRSRTFFYRYLSNKTIRKDILFN